jgi:uncharacterized membrane protein
VRQSRARLALGSFWIFAGTLHFAFPRTYQSIIPTYLAGWEGELVSASGAAEIAGGLAVLPARTRRVGRWWLLATVAAIFPANVHMAVNAEAFARIPEPLLWARLPFQGVFAWLIWRGTR